MRPLPGAGDRSSRYAAAAVTVLLAALGVVLIAHGLPSPGPPQPAAAATTPTRTIAPQSSSATQRSGPPQATGAAGAGEVDLGPVLAASSPVALDIPSIGVHARPLVDLALDGHGTLEAPRDFAHAGWYAAGPTPGQFGPAVIAGHVDSTSGPAVFYRLGALRPGALVRVQREDGSTATFTVDRVGRYPKDRFPTLQVYGNTTNRAELRLITCGGAFDAATGHYVDNIVAFAHLLR